MLRRLRREQTLGLLACLCAGVLLWRGALVVWFEPSATRMQYATDTRIDSILFGVIMALGFNPVLDEPRLVRPVAAAATFVASLLGILITVVMPSFFFRETLRYTLQGLLLIPIFYVLITRPLWPVIRWLESPLLRYIGAVSYTLYLVHDSFFQAIHFHVPQLSRVGIAVIGLGVSFLYAAAMRKWVELPLLDWRRRFRARAPEPARAQIIS
jgi:peptidoglycan/LPS O-acetylase OafA/YrhL